MKKVFLFIIIINSVSLPQIFLGFSLEGTGLITDTQTRIAPLTGISLLLELQLNEKLNIQAKGGYEPGVLDDYKGWNISAYANYFLIHPLFFVGGISLHANDPHDGISGGSTHESALLFGAGAGIIVNKNIAFELVYHIPLGQKEWIYHFDIITQTFSSEKLTGVIKANFKFAWEL